MFPGHPEQQEPHPGATRAAGVWLGALSCEWALLDTGLQINMRNMIHFDKICHLSSPISNELPII